MRTQVVIAREKIDFNKFVIPYGNRGNNKPSGGGFWTSSLKENGKSGWLEFTEAEGFYEGISGLTMYHVEISSNARILVIDTQEDYEKALEDYGMPAHNRKHPLAPASSTQVLDYEKLMMDYDAISLTEKGMYNNRSTFLMWDCESTVWINLNCFSNIIEVNNDNL